MKKALEALKKAEAETNRIDRLFDESPEDEAVEAAWMEAYKKEHEAARRLALEIVKATFGAIDEKTANRMIVVKRHELESLISRME